MLEKIKVALRVKNTAFDTEIADLISSAKSDLILSGVLEAKATDDDPLIIQAVKLYAKAHFGLENADSSKYQEKYESLKAHLCLSAKYTEV